MDPHNNSHYDPLEKFHPSLGTSNPEVIMVSMVHITKTGLPKPNKFNTMGPLTKGNNISSEDEIKL